MKEWSAEDFLRDALAYIHTDCPAGVGGLTGPLPDTYDSNPDGIRTGQDSPVRTDPGTGAWDAPADEDGVGEVDRG